MKILQFINPLQTCEGHTDKSVPWFIVFMIKLNDSRLVPVI